MSALLPEDLTEQRLFNAGMMELGALVCTARTPRCAECPLAASCAWRLAGFPGADAPTVRKQPRFAGSDRQRRGLVMAELRGSDIPVTEAELAGVLPDPEVRQRILSGLVADGLATGTADGWTLPGA
jgi:A/G-specific adenine glycosylase